MSSLAQIIAAKKAVKAQAAQAQAEASGADYSFEAAKAKADELIQEFGTQAYREAMKHSAKAELKDAQAFWQAPSVPPGLS